MNKEYRCKDTSCRTCRYGCRESESEVFCTNRMKWQFPEFKCSGYKPKTMWQKLCHQIMQTL